MERLANKFYDECESDGEIEEFSYFESDFESDSVTEDTFSEQIIEL